jgi:hypothetical protein
LRLDDRWEASKSPLPQVSFATLLPSAAPTLKISLRGADRPRFFQEGFHTSKTGGSNALYIYNIYYIYTY